MEESKMISSRKLIVIGGSAGSLQALFAIFDNLDRAFNIPVLIVVHRVTGADTGLQELLAAKSHLTVAEIEEKEMITDGYLYICPADYHVLIEPDGSFSLDASEKVNYSRPSIDVVFSAAADVFENGTIAILLSGANADGSEGLSVVKEKGGIVIVQDPTDAQVPYMPEHALKQVTPDQILSAIAISKYLNGLLH
jgi:two-component system, chemotaxis family, protein-glutamate methylesterase/glutaminase